MGRSVTRAYWYSVSRSQITRASPVALTVPTGIGQQQRDPDGSQDEAALQRRDRRQRQRQREGQEGAPRADERDEDERAGEGAHQRAEGRDRVQAPGDAPRLLHRAHAQAHRVGGDGAQQHHRHGDEHEHAEERADEGPGLDAVQRLDRDAQERPGDERHQRQQHGRPQDHPAEAGERRIAVGQAPTDPVARAQRHQDRGDGVGPHDGGGTEPRRQQPRGGDLGTERRGTDDGREDLDATRGHAGHPRRFVRLRS